MKMFDAFASALTVKNYTPKVLTKILVLQDIKHVTYQIFKGNKKST